MSLYDDADFTRLVRAEVGLGVMECRRQITILELQERGTLEEKVDFLLGLKADQRMQEEIKRLRPEYCRRIWMDGPLVTDPRHARRFSYDDAKEMTSPQISFGSRPLKFTLQDPDEWVIYIYTAGKPDVYLGNPPE